jgi:hypothetical protein
LRQVALEKAAQGALRRNDAARMVVTPKEIEAALGDVRSLTEGGIHGGVGGGG